MLHLIFPTKKTDPELAPFRSGLVFGFFNALTWQVGRSAPDGVVVNAMSPIAVTRMVTAALARVPASGSPGGSSATGGLSLGSMPQPEELGPLGAHLVGDDLSWCSGQVVFAGGSEVAVVEPPRLLEAVRTADAASLAAVLGSVVPGALVPAEVAVEEIRRGQWGSGARDKLLASLNLGQAIVNYTGHGSTDMWRGQLLSTADARVLTNEARLPLFVMMTCLNGYFHDSSADSLAESLMKAERGGAVAVWASSAITVPAAQASMNQALYRLIFAPNNPDARSLTLGEAFAIVKAGVSDADLRRSLILFGDPTMQLR